MPIPDIQLDDRSFDELFKQARARIPRYTPEWTDHNESDPGITLLQLNAWLTEMILYRLNKVPEKNYLKFLELVGIQLERPTAARAELTFTLSSKDLGQARLIPQGTRVGLAEAGEGGPVVFETDDNLYAIGAELKEVQSYDGARFRLLTEASRVPGKFFHAFGEHPRSEAALYLGFDRDFPEGRYRLLVHAYTADLIAEGQGVAADMPESSPPVLAHWEFWAGEDAGWRRLSVVRDDTAALTRTGFVEVEAPEGWVTTRLGLLQREEDEPLHWLRFRIEEELGAGYEIAPRLEDVLVNTVTATHAVTLRDELLGPADGLPGQSFRLSSIPILPATLALEVDEGSGFEVWREVRDFAGSTRDDRHYTLDLATGEVRFGDGEQGKIPQVLGDVTNPVPNLRASVYRSGGGAGGNAGARKITSLQSTVPYVASVTNLRPSDGGRDEESLAAAKERAPQVIRSGSRAVTAADFDFLATRTPDARIRRATTLPLRHPNLEPRRPAGAGLPATAVPVPGVVTVVVVPDSLGAQPLPSEETLLRVGRWLHQHSLVTTEIYVAAPRYRKVEVEARVTADPSASSAAVAEALEGDLLRYFHPLTGGGDGGGWEFGGKISFARTLHRILSVSGVLALDSDALTLFVDDVRRDPCVDVELAPDELVYSLKHSIFVSYP